MEERGDLSLAEDPQAGTDAVPGQRLAEERASRILERAAALDAERSSEVEVAELREAAAGAGISREAFDQAMREQADSLSEGGAHGSGRATATSNAMGAIRAPGAVEVAHYAALLRDLLGEDSQVVVVEDQIECSDSEGVMVSISPSSGDTTATVVAGGKLSRRLLGSVLPMLIPTMFGVMVYFREEDVGFGILLGTLVAAVAGIGGSVISHRKERKALRKKSERIRRQLQRMLNTPPNES